MAFNETTGKGAPGRWLRAVYRAGSKYVASKRALTARPAFRFTAHSSFAAEWRSSVFPLSLLLTLLALTSWLRYVSETPSRYQDGAYRHDPDVIIGNGVARKIDAEGKLQYTLVSKSAYHYPDDGSTFFVSPNFVYFSPNKPPLVVTSNEGTAHDGADTVDLAGQVRIVREKTENDPPVIMETSQLTVLADEEKAFTRAPVLITQGKTWVRGVGMRIDYRAQTYFLDSKARARIESK